MENTTETPPTVEHPTNSPRVILLVIGLTIFVLFLTYVAFLGQNRQQPAQPTPVITTTPTPVDETVYTESTRSANWKTYKNDELQYEFKYPPNSMEPSRAMGDTSFVIGYGLGGETNAKSINTYWISPGFISQSQRSTMGISYCEANSQEIPRCETRIIGGATSIIDWKIPVEFNDYTSGKQEKKTQIKATVWIPHPKGGIVTFYLQPVVPESQETFNQILSTFKFINSTATCIPRPACLDATPRCLIPESENMCPRSTPTTKPTTKPDQVVCTADAKLCPDGSYVSRTGPKCEFAPCP